MKMILLKVADYAVFFAIGLIIIYAIAHSVSHVGIIKNLPDNMNPAEKKTIYEQLMSHKINS